MKTFCLSDMKAGWFVGDFLPTCYRLSECEVACKYYKKGDSEERHVHKVATEITVIASGHVVMNDVEYGKGDIILLEPGESADFHVLEDAITVVVKMPSLKDDKYSA
jgi:hypothetical protein